MKAYYLVIGFDLRSLQVIVTCPALFETEAEADLQAKRMTDVNYQCTVKKVYVGNLKSYAKNRRKS